MTDIPAVDVRDVRRTHVHAGVEVHSLDGVDLAVARGEVVAVVGPSGSGKTTLLHLAGGLDAADGGVVRVAGTDWRSLRGNARAAFRRRTCGFVVQGAGLLPQATAAENVEVPLLLEGVEEQQRQSHVADALEAVGLAAEAPKLPDQLSGGQQQRVAIARALVMDPAVILADEPTGSLDSATAGPIVELLLSAARRRGAAVILVTHDPTVAARADRVVRLRAGRIETDDDPADDRAP
jgi:putative ABC transport system ATP-binding protein